MPEQTLQALVDLLGTKKQADDMVKAVETLLSIVKDIQKTNEAELKGLQDASEMLKDKALKSINAALFDLTNRTNEHTDKTLTQAQKKIDKALKELATAIANIKNGEDADEQVIVDKVLALLPPPPQIEPAVDVEETPEELRSKLEKLTGDDRLDISAIKGIENMTKDIAEVKGRVQTPAKAFRIYVKDCTSQCDGNNKAFTVGGSHFGIVGVYGTEFPINFRPVIDYTETRTGILLTDQVSAPAAGQTLVIQFLK